MAGASRADTRQYPIQYLTKICQNLFGELVDAYPGDEWLENRQADFNMWSSGIKAASTGKSSLDYRVRDHPNTSNAICNYLGGLEELLERYLHPADQKGGDASDSESVEAINDADSVAEIRVAFRSIMHGLARISSSIRRSGTKFRFKAADSTFQANEGDLQDLERLLTISIFRSQGCLGIKRDVYEKQGEFASSSVAAICELALSPGWQTRVQVRLVQANLVRHHRILYATRTMRESSHASMPVEPQRLQKIEKPQRTTPRPLPTPSGPAPEVIGGSPPSVVSAPITKTATEIGSQYDEKSVLRRQTSTVVTQGTRTGLTHEYPPCPKPTPDGIIQCPYCAETLPGDYASNKARWRGHIARDLIPYTCIFEDCSSPEEMYSTRAELEDHMRQEHSVIRWTCQDCNSLPTTPHALLFNEEQDWKNHMSTKHGMAFQADQFPILSKLATRTTIAPFTCPLCRQISTDPSSDELEHLAECLHGFALLALPPSNVRMPKDGSRSTSGVAMLGEESIHDFEDMDQKSGQDPELKPDESRGSSLKATAKAVSEIPAVSDAEKMESLSLWRLGLEDPPERSLVGFELADIDEIDGFVSREKELAEIHEVLCEGGDGRTPVLHGLGGLRKTSLQLNSDIRQVGLDSGSHLLAIRGEGTPEVVVNAVESLSGPNFERTAGEAGSDLSYMTISDGGDELYAKAYPSGSAKPAVVKPTLDESSPLSLRLRTLRCSSSTPNSPVFFPKGSVEDLITQREVVRVIKDGSHNFTPPLSEEQIREYAQKVCQMQPAGGQQPSYRKVFAILVLIRRGWEIVLFVDDELCDAELPLAVIPNIEIDPSGHLVELRRKRDQDKSLACLRNWGPSHHEEFDKLQWSMLAPFFAKGKRRHIWFYQLSKKDILPWTEADHKFHQGGFSYISRIKIHPNHHNFDDTEMSDGTFALKHFKANKHTRLAGSAQVQAASNDAASSTTLSDIKKEFEAEIEILKSFSGEGHPHLISLLAAYQQGDNYCLLFHWAKSDLHAMWKNDQPGAPLEKPNLEWMLDQCCGIASGLLRIHAYQSTETRSDQTLSQGAIFGRHGDIKPQKILHFAKRNKPDDRGILVITDFGLTRFNSDMSKTYFPEKDVAATPTYRPPECDMEGCTISRSFDIWSFGCVMLEFITWYLGGWDYLNAFVQQRKAPNVLMYGWNTDQFFEIVRPEGNTNGPVYARVKVKVYEFINGLHAHEACTDIIHELLDFIKDQMLVIESKGVCHRATCDQVHGKLEQLSNRLKQEPDQLVGKPRLGEAGIPEAVEMPLNAEARRLASSRFSHLREHTGMTHRLPALGYPNPGPRRTQTGPALSRSP